MQDDAIPTPPVDMLPPVESLQFRRAEHLPDPSAGPQCAACKKAAGPEYYQANGTPVCPRCASAIRQIGQPLPTRILLKALLCGSGAALVGCILYATVAIVTGLELALIAILIGYMVARAIRYVSPGGRPLQIMAVTLTYLSISTSYVPISIYHFAKNRPAKEDTAQVTARDTVTSPAAIVAILAGLALAGPFLGLKAGVGGIISLVIIFFGLQRAWRMTATPDIVVSGPYQAQVLV